MAVSRKSYNAWEPGGASNSFKSRQIIRDTPVRTKYSKLLLRRPQILQWDSEVNFFDSSISNLHRLCTHSDLVVLLDVDSMFWSANGTRGYTRSAYLRMHTRSSCIKSRQDNFPYGPRPSLRARQTTGRLRWRTRFGYWGICRTLRTGDPGNIWARQWETGGDVKEKGSRKSSQCSRDASAGQEVKETVEIPKTVSFATVMYFSYPATLSSVSLCVDRVAHQRQEGGERLRFGSKGSGDSFESFIVPSKKSIPRYELFLLLYSCIWINS